MRQTRDPITGFRDRIVGANLAELSELKAIEAKVCNLSKRLKHLKGVPNFFVLRFC